MRKSITFGGAPLTQWGVYISGQGTFGAPKKAYTFQRIPGKNGDMIFSDKRFENIEVTYPAFIYSNFKENIKKLRNYLLSRDGYVKLTDGYHTDEFRLAAYVGDFVPDVTKKNDAGSFDLVFNCKPQRFLNSGNSVIPGSPANVYNQTQFPALPLINVNFTSEFNLYVGAYFIVSNGLADTGITSAVIDCETMQVYSGSTNLTKYISVQKGTDYTVDFPSLAPVAITSIRTTYSGVTWSIIPRWWQL